ncbi:DUF3325 domain-containing protein [Stenotrophomonas sp. Marseille-Q4652]|uniref:DUF3325 domain-containing protein n=1 Tax=Stenotrophomonas sp. Marseille-Q4652 TaxID=2866595 RepID=UPI001CE421EC|nr:DUF3325 domain-containing protein [Stenotrophomonas sp. Marseille-Q4652]
MAEPAMGALLLLGATLAAVAGMAWWALSLPVHAQQVWGLAIPPSQSRVLRGLGTAGLLASLVLCLCADHASMAVLVWFMSLAGAALAVAFTLSWRPRWLGVLAPWTHMRR